MANLLATIISSDLTVNGSFINHGSFSNTTTTGYTKLTNGIIIQWGHYTQTTSSAIYNFPLVFPSACRAIWATKARTDLSASSTQTAAAAVGLRNATSFFLDSNDAGGTNFRTFILAIGY